METPQETEPQVPTNPAPILTCRTCRHVSIRSYQSKDAADAYVCCNPKSVKEVVTCVVTGNEKIVRYREGMCLLLREDSHNINKEFHCGTEGRWWELAPPMPELAPAPGSYTPINAKEIATRKKPAITSLGLDDL